MEKPIWDKLLDRNTSSKEVLEKVKQILENIKTRGFEAVKEYTKRFDGIERESFEVPKKEMQTALNGLTVEERKCIERSIASVRAICLEEKKNIKNTELNMQDSKTLLRYLPLAKVGIYVPAGKAPLPTSVIMASIPAQVAGVKELILCSPPQKDGQVNKYILATAALCGVTKVYAIGGAQAIGALAYCFNVDLIAGPGNVYVSAAKQIVQSQGACTIDMLAGPSEVLVVLESVGNPKLDAENCRLAASDMLAQAEHGPTSAAVCITTSKELGQKVREEVEKQLNALKDQTPRESIRLYGTAIVTKSMQEAISLANEFAAEHVEIFAKDAKKYAMQITNAGAIFVNTAEVFGDYGFDSSNHILPTGRSARFASGVSIQTFMKRQYVKIANAAAQAKWAEDCARFARMEQLEAHAKSAECRQF